MNKKALHDISYGLYVICSRKGDKINGQIANTVVQVCAEPVMISRGNISFHSRFVNVKLDGGQFFHQVFVPALPDRRSHTPRSRATPIPRCPG